MGVALTLLALTVGCGSDKGGSDAGDAGASKDGGGSDKDAGPENHTNDKDGGGGGTGGSSAKDGGGGSLADRDSAALDEDGGVEPCGAVTCIDPECCADPFQSLCGVGAGRACLMPPPENVTEDPRCPSFAIASYSFPSCCTTDGDCGLAVQMAGIPCLELSQFKMAAESMGAPPDIGIPDPQKCN
jgi:hypothetical protein